MNVRSTQSPGRWGLWKTGKFAGLWAAFRKRVGRPEDLQDIRPVHALPERCPWDGDGFP